MRRNKGRGAPLRQPLPRVHVPDPLVAARDNLYTFGEELAHAVTHGLGAVLSIVGLVVLVVRASLYGDTWHVVACSVFGATLVMMYSASTLYHSIPMPRARHVLRVIDHSLIYFLIAGTYTPFTLVSLHGPWGWSLFGFTWGLAVIGVGLKIFTTGRYEKISLAVYLMMGWCAIVAVKPLIDSVEPEGLILLAAGGITYSGGVAFYTWQRLRYHHAIWHLFVLGGSVLHWFTVYYYVVPGPPG
ncbi:MAG: PAQR family membrane homeostasis protein TrhA [Panacagrimonas sp.]